MTPITNTEARDKIISRISSAKPRHRFASDWTRAKYLARGERILGIVGGLGFSVVYSPANARTECPFDRLLFFGETGVLVHEEPGIRIQHPETDSLAKIFAQADT